MKVSGKIWNTFFPLTLERKMARKIISGPLAQALEKYSIQYMSPYGLVRTIKIDHH